VLLFKQAGRATKAVFDIVSCAKCGHIRTDPRIPDERLGELYDAAYYRGGGFDPNVDYLGPVTQWTRNENAGILATVRDALGTPLSGVRWLDIGCGTGTLLDEVRKSGAAGFGHDDSEAAVESCSRKGIPVLDSTELDGLRGTFDVVSAVEVIEHVADPIGFVKYMASFARIGGVVYVHTENWNVVRHLPGRPYVMPEGHIQYFTPQSMREVFAGLGLREARVFNRSWFVWRRLPKFVQNLVPVRSLPLLQQSLVRFAPGFAPFPVAIRID